MKTIVIAAFIAAIGSAATATTFTETSDLPGVLVDLQGPLSAATGEDFTTPGSYSVSGSLSQSDAADVFTAAIGPDRIIENIVVTYSNVMAAFSGQSLPDTDVSHTTNVTVYFPAPPATSPQLVFALNPGAGNSSTNLGSGANSLLDDQTYVFGLGINGNSLGAIFGTFSADWSVSFDVIDTSATTVPLPASSLLLLGSLGGLAALRRRKRR